MKPRINFHGVSRDADVADYIERRCTFAFNRMQHAIGNTTVTLTDVNGPKGGVDKQCRIVITSAARSPIVICEQQSSLRLAIDRAIGRASRNLAQQLNRKQSRYRLHSESKNLSS